MNITTLSKNELISHTAEIVSTKDHIINALRAEDRVLKGISR